MDGNQRDLYLTPRRNQAEDEALPDLALTMQSMSLSQPGLCRVQDNQMMQQKELDFSFCLIMKIACTGGTPRSISEQTLEQSLRKAWRGKFYAISQVSNTVFIAHFRSNEDRIAIFARQPWKIGSSDNLLMDWFDPDDIASSSSDYKFEDILVTVRAYGIPRGRRSINLLADILNQVGQLSEFHVLQDINLFAKQDYIWGTARLAVNRPVKDRVMVTYADNTTGLAYLFYEKIGRICLFCGTMFHNMQNCALRNNLISERARNRQSGSDIPAQRFGPWIIDEDLIPSQAIQNSRMGNAGYNQRGNDILNRLQSMFANDLEERDKPTAPQHIQATRVNYPAQGLTDANRRDTNISQYSFNLNEKPPGYFDSIQTAPLNEKSLSDTNHDEMIRSTQLSLAQQEKRSGQIMNATEARPTALQPQSIGNTIQTVNMQGIMGVPTRTLQEANISNQSAQASSHGQAQQHIMVNPQNVSAANSMPPLQRQSPKRPAPYTLPSSPTHAKRALPNTTAAGIRIRTRPRGWDIPESTQTGLLDPPLGITTYQQGAAIWNRVPTENVMSHTGPHRRGRSGYSGAMSHPYMHSPSRSPTRSFSPAGSEHEPWALRPISPASSIGTQDSRMGLKGQSEPEIGDQSQMCLHRMSENQQQTNEGRTMDLDDGQRAPALKAPREP